MSSVVETKSCAMYRLALMFHALGCKHCLLKVQIAANWLLPYSLFWILYFCMHAFVKRRTNFFFQDLNETSVTNATGFPDLTKCFQVTVLVWIPCGYLLTVAPCYIWSLVTSPRSYIRHTWLNVTKTVIDPTVRHCILLSIAIFSTTSDTLFLYVTMHTLQFMHYHLYVTVHTLPIIRYCLYITDYTLPLIYYRLYITIYTLPFINYHSLI